MPAKKRTSTQQTALSSAPVKQPKPLSTEETVINSIRFENGIPTALVRKLMKTAHNMHALDIHIGVNGSENEVESVLHPSNPRYFYNGRDIKKLEHFVFDSKSVLNCSATLSYGDGGTSLEDADDIENAIQILSENYRDASLILYF